jgi:hypothetical protein
MKLVAARALARHPWNIARLPTGELLILGSSDDGRFLEAYDAELASIWSVRLPDGASELALAADGTPWVLDSAGASAFGSGGSPLARLEVPRREGMGAAAFALVDGNFVFACQHDDDAPMCAPILERFGSDGSVRWSTTLPVGSIAYEGVTEMRASEGWKSRSMDPWTPETWWSTLKVLQVSGDAVLACFSEMPRSGIGCGYVVSLSDGALRFTTTLGPIHEVAALGAGAFLVGYQGYGAFETLRYERDGRVLTRWASHGYYVIEGDDVRVIEMENRLPSKMHLVRLLPNGAVKKGAWLDGYYTPDPCLLADGRLLFFRAGALCSARNLSIEDRLVFRSADERSFATPIVAGEGSAYFAFTPADGEEPRLVRVDW